jgi:hypothetical protein
LTGKELDVLNRTGGYRFLVGRLLALALRLLKTGTG